MNKTININLAGLFFHIDEDAYGKLQRYLAAIKRSLTEPQGRDEIIQDIEARIAELFSERIKNERQVIALIDVDAMIAIMGQPEDYKLDEEIFEEEEPKATYYTHTPTSTNRKKLYRDIDNSYIGGVCSGLGHYLGIDALWIRLIFLALILFSKGGALLLYIGLWIFIKAAITTSEKLEMRGKPVNIDNIQRKVKEGFDTVADSVKSVDYEKYGNQAKKGANTFMEGLGKFIMLLFTIVAKLIGIFLVIMGGAAVIGLFVALFTAGTLGFMDGGYTDYLELFISSNIPFWVISVIGFFATAIPFFALFYLGLKILITNLRRMPWAVKITLIVLWLVSVVMLSAIGIRQAMDFNERGEVSEMTTLATQPLDTLTIKMDKTHYSNFRGFHGGPVQIEYVDGKPNVSYRNLDVIIKSSRDSITRMEVVKKARGFSNSQARQNAESIVFHHTLNAGMLELPGAFTTSNETKYRDQELDLILYLPEGTTVYLDENTRGYLWNFPKGHYKTTINGSVVAEGSWGSEDYTGRYLTMIDGKLVCTDCPEEVEELKDTYDNEEAESDLPNGMAKDSLQEKNANTVYDYDEAIIRKDSVQ